MLSGRMAVAKELFDPVTRFERRANVKLKFFNGSGNFD
jgi:hypothetical protein